MPYPIEEKLVIAVSSSALFDFKEADNVFNTEGLEAYKRYQKKNLEKPFPKGVAFPFISRILQLNESFPEEQPIEVVLISRNSPDTGLRVFRSINYYHLNITRGGFSSGKPMFHYLPAFNSSLFLSANENDVKEALKEGYAAGRVLNKEVVDDEGEKELRIAFDFDGVLADDETEIIYKESSLEEAHKHEEAHKLEPLKSGPMASLMMRLSNLQKLENQHQQNNPDYKKIIKTAIVTARNAPAHERMIRTLASWKIEVDELFLLGGIDKSRVLNIMKPHIFFDDQVLHLEHINKIPAVHIPFGVANKEK